MAVFKILFLLAAVQVVYPKPFLFKEMNVKKNFEFSFKPVLKSMTFIKEWKPFGPVKVKHTVAKRSPSPPPTINSEPTPSPLFKVGLEKSLELNSEVSPPLPPHLHKEADMKKQLPTADLPPGHRKIHEEIHEENFHDIPKPPLVGKRLTQIDLGRSSVLPPESHKINWPLHVSPIPPPHVAHEDYLKESRLSGNSPPTGLHSPQVTTGQEYHLQREPKPKKIEHSGIADENPFLGSPKSSSSAIHWHPPPPPPPHLDKITPLPPGKGNQGTLEAFFEPPSMDSLHSPSGPPNHKPNLPTGATGQGSFPDFSRPSPAGIQKGPVPPHHMPELPRQVTGQGSLPVLEFARPPPAGIREKPEPHRQTLVFPPGLTEQGAYPGFVTPPPAGVQESNTPPLGSLFTDISRVDEINAYLKAIDALPLVKPPLEENVLQVVPGNSIEPVGPKNLTVDTKAEPSTLAKGSRLALYFGNILLQVMSQAIGSARSAIGQYSMPSMI